ncbi:MAG: hypothetical protein A3I10_00685 [Deltaproteobacteria bacterium RIFCSPLOWO2_02_FULL_57_26]|nr:MAG: hypothetical protein A3I10_00685 [Deltaproteobacteria bacterium RIFCSPLOWO2_02_FULL_57_26]
MSGIDQPQCAVRVVLFRPREDDGFDIYLMRRGPECSYDFPGRDISKEDWREAILRRCRGLSRGQAQKRLGSELRSAIALGHWVAAIRALFEEVGVLFCVPEAGDPREITEREEQLAIKRRELAAGKLGFRAFLESEGLLCDMTRLAYFSHWLEPAPSRGPAHTRYFLARLPRNQGAVRVAPEFREWLWLTPERALQEHSHHTLAITFSVFASLRALADLDSWRSLCVEYRLQPEGEDPREP